MTVLKANIYGIKKGRSLRLGKEVTNGTQVAVTTYWRGEAKANDMRIVEKPEEDLSILSSNLRGYIPVKGTEIEISDTPATFEQLPILLDSGVSKVTPAKDGAGTGYIAAYSFHSSPAAFNSIGARTAEHGDNQEVDTGTFFFTRELTISGTAKKPLMMSATMEGRTSEPVVYTPATTTVTFNATGKHILDSANGLAVFTAGMSIRVSGSVSNDGIYTVVTPGAGDCVVSEAIVTEASAVAAVIEQVFTATATIPTVEEIQFGNGKLYIGEVGTAIGSLAQVTNTWLGMSFKASQCGQQALFTGDGRLDFAGIKPIPAEISLELTMEWNGKATAERRLAKLGTVRKFRMLFDGSTLATAGTTYTKKTLMIDGCGLWDTFKSIDEQNGDDIIKASMTVGYNATAALYCTITVVNALSAVL